MPASSRRERNREAIWRSMALGRRSDIVSNSRPACKAKSLRKYSMSQWMLGPNCTLPDGQMTARSGVFLRRRAEASLHTASDQKLPSQRQGQNAAAVAVLGPRFKQRGRLNGRLAFGAKLFSRFAIGHPKAPTNMHAGA